MSKIELIQGDCLEKMKDIEDGSVDMVLTDPPYGTSACKWDSVIPFEPMWERLNKLIKPNGAIVLFGSEPFSSALRMSNIKNYKYDWVWDKKKPSTGLHAKIMPLKDYENVMVFNVKKENYNPVMKDATERNDKARVAKNGEAFGGKEVLRKHSNNGKAYPRSIIKDFSNANQNNRFHPTQKPVALMEYLIKTYTNEGETVLDFTMGSFTTAIACLNTKRSFIGIEKDEHYFQVGKDRLEKHLLTLDYTTKIIYNQV